jgi:hypothetical protein
MNDSELSGMVRESVADIRSSTRVDQSSAAATRCAHGGGEFPPRPQRSSWRAGLPWA